MDFATLIDTSALQALLGRPDVVVLDCRFELANPDAGRRAYSAGHIPTARYADLNQDLSSPVSARSGRHPLPAPEHLAARLGDWGIGNHRQVIAYDDAAGAMAARAWWLLRWLGHRRVAVLDGGFKAWLAAGGAVDSQEPGAARRATFLPHVDTSAVLGTAEVIQALGNPRRVLIDARLPERFSGALEALDTVAGHVPGAVNYPYVQNLGLAEHFLEPRELERRWRERLAGAQPADVIAMCGSGVTACHNLLAMEHAGLPGAALYAGSWSEWIRDPERPTARGT